MSPITQNNALALLRRAVDNPKADFRPGQWEAIDGLVNHKKRLLVVERTGWGKSYVYFIATKILRDMGSGPTLIVSPLLSLMRNQIEAADRLEIQAKSINSNNREDWPSIIYDTKNNEVDALLISPERLANDEFVDEVLIPISQKIGLLVVDEVHCISDWGHDFRPDYRRLVNVLQQMPDNMPIIGTTATANNRVIEDVVDQLGNVTIQRGPLMRDTLQLQTHRLPSRAARLAWLAKHVSNLPGTGIIYTLTIRDAEQVTDWLKRNGVHAEAYYSRVSSPEYEDPGKYREALEQRLLANEIKVLVATTALGMGFDKPDLGFVIHYQAPGSIVAYYQQVGRAGRGIDNAIGVLFSGDEDNEIIEYFRRSAFPKEEWVEAILKALEESDGMSTVALEGLINLRRGQIEAALKYLSVESPAPVIKTGSTWRRTPVPYKMDQEKIRRLTAKREVEWHEVQKYLDTTGCLMTFLAMALDDDNAQACGRCANCLGTNIIEPSFDRETGIAAATFLKQAEMPFDCKIKIPKGALQKSGLSGNLGLGLRAETGRILSRWQDAGWGQLVAEDKKNGKFRDELVLATKDLLLQRWCPDPMPAWVTCVPSLKNPTLVQDFAERLALSLELPFKPVVHKVIDNKPQKIQQNSFFQCRNLDGVFEISPKVPEGPVLLVDDVVDSKWTLTVVSALLRRQGSGIVLPFALAASAAGA